MAMSNIHTYFKIGMQICFVIILCVAFTVGIISQSTFVVTKNKQIVAVPYKEVLTELEIECVAKCQSSLSCTAANFFDEARTCYMFNRTCFRTAEAIGWHYLHRPPPKRTFQYIPLQLTWDNAKSYCESIGGGLANVMTTTDYMEILNIVNQIESTSTHIWLGGADKDIEGEWIWSNGCRFDDQSFNFWAATEPNNVNNNEHCLILRILDLHWHDLVCGLKKHFLCEFVSFT